MDTVRHSGTAAAPRKRGKKPPPPPQTPVVVDLHTFDLVLVSSSAGKDSQAQLDVIVRQADATGYDRARIVVVHCDLGRVEWAGTRELAETQAKLYGLRFIAISRPQGDLLTQVEQRGMWPSSQARYCTSDQKRGQFAKVVTQLHREAVEAGHVGVYRVVECLGLRALESEKRGLKPQFVRNERLTTATRTVDTWLPIFTWTVADVWACIKASGVPHHEAYDFGMPRLSCVFCVLSNPDALGLAAKHNPELLDAYVAVEDKIGHTFKKGFSLRVLRDTVRAGGTLQGPVADWTM
jgi:3'-phosphoadenosine 5'-phosphosulfate sulfotransferase (PAPS reductase)/FAD synthetase